MLHKYTLQILIKLERMREHATRPDDRERYSEAVVKVINTYEEMLQEINEKKKSADAGTPDGQAVSKYNTTSL